VANINVLILPHTDETKRLAFGQFKPGILNDGKACKQSDKSIGMARLQAFMSQRTNLPIFHYLLHARV